jgi:hypothetical protein
MGSAWILGAKAFVYVQPPLSTKINTRTFKLDEERPDLAPLSTEDQCIVQLGEWEQYCTIDLLTETNRANRIRAWEYVVGKGCSMRPFTPENVIKSMIEDGGWSIIGDSLSREVPFL